MTKTLLEIAQTMAKEKELTTHQSCELIFGFGYSRSQYNKFRKAIKELNIENLGTEKSGVYSLESVTKITEHFAKKK